MLDFVKLGGTIRELREKRNISQPQLAMRLNQRGYPTTPSYVSRIERGVKTGYSVSLLAAIAESLNVSAWELLK